MTELGRGLGDVGRGFAFLNKHPRLWGWVMAPAAVTLVLLSAMIYAILRIADRLVVKMTSWMPDAIIGVGEWIVWVIVFAALVFGGLLVFVAVAGVVAGPFNELLSEAVEEKVTGKSGPPFSFGAFVQSFARGIGHGLRRVALAIGIAIALFVLGFIPVIGTIAALLLGYYFSAKGAAYDCYDSILSRRDLSYSAKLAYLDKYSSRSLGLGATVTAMLIVPFVNLVALGLGAAGATLAVLDQQAKNGS